MERQDEGKRGTRPSAPRDQRTASTYIFGAICPETGEAAGLVLPWCNTEAMGLHLAEISARVTPGKHCALLVDQAGWHISERLTVPSNITIVPLPAKCPELNPVENVWQFMRDNWLSNRVFRSYDATVDHCCYAWNPLVDRPCRVMSIGLRDWAMRHTSVSLSITSWGRSPIRTRKYIAVFSLAGLALTTAAAAEATSIGLSVAAISAALFLSFAALNAVYGLSATAVPANTAGSLASIQNFGGYFAALAPTITGFVVQPTGSFVPALLFGSAVGAVGTLGALLFIGATAMPPDVIAIGGQDYGAEATG